MYYEMMKELADYCRESIEDFDMKCRIAIHKIDIERAPLSVVYYDFYLEIESCVEEYIEDKELNDDFWDKVDFDSLISIN